MPQVEATAPWGEIERSDPRAPRIETPEIDSDRRRHSDSRLEGGFELDAYPRTTRAGVASSDFDFAAARAASAARRRSGPARPAAHFAAPVAAVELAPVPARPRPARSTTSRARRLAALPAARDEVPARRESTARRAPATRSESPRPARRESVARDLIETPPRRTPEGRRIVTITGRGSERYAAVVERRRPAQRAYEREGFRPDRAAMWAVLLGVLMILAAATSAHGAVLAHHAAHALSYVR